MNNALPSLQQLRIFEAVATHESISLAAKAVNLSQPSVSLAVKQLENKIGEILFDRRRTGCYATAAGATLLPRVTRMSTQVRQALCEPIVGPPFAARNDVIPLERRMTDAHVRSLIAVSESASFDEAARRINITEPSLHRAARTLEQILRRTLYRRTAQGFTTTPAATELARRFKVAAREIEYAIDEISAERGHIASRIIVGNIPHSNARLLSAAINELLTKFPDASVDVRDGHYDDLLAALRSGSVDLVYGVLRLPKWALDVEEQFLFANRYAVVARRDHPLRALQKVTIADLARYDWILPPLGTPRRHAFEEIFKRYKLPPKVSVETTSVGIYQSLLPASDKLSLYSYREIEGHEVAAFDALPYHSPRLQRAEGIAIRKDWRPTRIHLEFMDRLKGLALRPASER